MEKRKLYIIIGILIVLLLLTRFLFIDVRPLHHDEGVNYFFAKNIISKQGYAYDYTNYHGPLYFFLLAISFLVFGISEFSLRFPAVVFGVLIVLAVLFFQYRKKWDYRAVIALFLILSPSLMFYSRYSIHESGFVLFSLVSVFLLSLMIEKKSLYLLPYFALFLALLFATKETVIILLGAMFLICVFNFKSLRKIDYKEYKKEIVIAVLIFVFIYVYLYTNLFSHLPGLSDSFKGFMPWIDRGLHEPGHDKPFFYYSLLLLKYELPLVLFGLAGLFFSLRKKNIWDKNIGIWFLSTWLVYSFISYKTPWLIINMSVPLALLAGIGVIELWKLKKIRKIVGVLFLLSVIYLGYYSYYTNFDKPWQSENKFAYVHSDIDILNLRDAARQGDKILIISDIYWPLPFYLDGKDVAYLGENRYYYIEDYFNDYDVFIVYDGVFDSDDFGPEYGYDKYVLRDGQELWVVGKN